MKKIFFLIKHCVDNFYLIIILWKAKNNQLQLLLLRLVLTKYQSFLFKNMLFCVFLSLLAIKNYSSGQCIVMSSVKIINKFFHWNKVCDVVPKSKEEGKSLVVIVKFLKPIAEVWIAL